MALLENNSWWEIVDSKCIFLTFLALYISINKNKNHPTRHLSEFGMFSLTHFTIWTCLSVIKVCICIPSFEKVLTHLIRPSFSMWALLFTSLFCLKKCTNLTYQSRRK
jgi:hypothetical protein